MQEHFAQQLVEKMENFFQEMRDMCRDHILTLPQEIEINKKIDKDRFQYQQQKQKSAFYYYFQDRKEALQQKYPRSQLKALIKHCSKEWSHIPTDKQQFYQKRAQEVSNIEKEIAIKDLPEEPQEENSNNQ